MPVSPQARQEPGRADVRKSRCLPPACSNPRDPVRPVVRHRRRPSRCRDEGQDRGRSALISALAVRRARSSAPRRGVRRGRDRRPADRRFAEKARPPAAVTITRDRTIVRPFGRAGEREQAPSGAGTAGGAAASGLRRPAVRGARTDVLAEATGAVDYRPRSRARIRVSSGKVSPSPSLPLRGRLPERLSHSLSASGLRPDSGSTFRACLRWTAMLNIQLRCAARLVTPFQQVTG